MRPFNAPKNDNAWDIAEVNRRIFLKIHVFDLKASQVSWAIKQTYTYIGRRFVVLTIPRE